MSAAILTLFVSHAVVALPPPLCRGRVVGAYDPRLDAAPSDRAHAEVKLAYEVLCPKNDCGAGEIFENATMGNNAATWVSGLRDGQRTRAKIVYSAQFLNALSVSFGPGASFGVLAHEVGHHLTAALSMRQPMESSWNEELRADYLAGCALGRSGRNSAELENAFRALASVATSSHPSFRDRIPVVRKGYDECRGQAGMVAKNARPFGLGTLVQEKRQPESGFGYWYRLKEDVDKLGPVAAKRRRSDAHASQSACEAARRAITAARVSEACTHE